jgi:ribosomal protein S18 acetylase RimI-like enzyme
MGNATCATPVPRSLVLATGLDVLPVDRVIEQRDGYVLVRSPGNPSHYWGNYLLFESAPQPGDGGRWEALFDAEFGSDPRVRHRTFAWDETDGVEGAARDEFVARGYDLDDSIGVIAAPDEVQAHPRENRDVIVRSLDPAPGADEDLWDAVVELQVANADEDHEEQAHRAFTRKRLEDLRAHFRAGRGAWYAALDPVSGALSACCGIVVTGGRARFQAVDTAQAFRRRGICSRLVVEAAKHSADHHGADRFVIAADTGYHALGLYESLGFTRTEHVFGVCHWPRGRQP